MVKALYPTDKKILFYFQSLTLPIQLQDEAWECSCNHGAIAHVMQSLEDQKHMGCFERWKEWVHSWHGEEVEKWIYLCEVEREFVVVVYQEQGYQVPGQKQGWF